ncbi:uncharacterized protein DUF4815 [Tepidimonas ignava]|uniref:Uncharacterized protein DUF4815 n=1 Tax=Tepidimonas ignava TaxID=114249 RepID=A0A4R3LMP6_9BURK|nr:DUF4815 domain-containing protein [Tepidimonas ignava]TCS99116.1 uncharacterized protein DUF4815 [Tepidimonas ignava]TSE22800.1 hypothetical protein Tigna_00775 [Tepidimonas ignava]
MLERYYNLFDPSKRYAELLFRAGDGLQSRELNELQTTINHRLKGVADALLKDGNIVSGGEIVIDAGAGRALLAAARIYIKGAVHEVPAAEFAIPTTGEVTLGVRLKETVITELEDPSLREPAVGVRNYQEPGAGRLKVEALWGWAGAGGADANSGLPFYPVASVIDGVLQSRERPPAFDGVKQMLARYDYDANGHYLVSGLGVRYLGRRSEDGKLTFALAAGVCNVAGFKVEKPYDDRLALDFDPDIQRVLAEPTVFAPNAQGRMRINVNRAPLAQVVRVQGTRRKTATITHGVFSGAADTLPDAAVVQVLSVKQGSTTYQVGQDYTVAGNVINWAPAGAEPAPGSAYEVTYDYIAQVTATNIDEDGFTVEGFVAGTLVQVDYDWMLPRMDALVINRDGLVQRIKGVAVERNPNPPAVPADLLRLCDLHLTWRAAQPVRVIDSAVRAVPTYELQAMRDDIARLYGMIARDRLTQDITLREPAAKAGVFADPFRNDGLRDAGIAQSAVIVDGALRAPIAATVLGPYLTQPQMLPFGLATALEQTARTGSMKVNPYQAVLPAPATVTLNPARDFWTEFQNSQAAAITETIVRGSGLLSRTTVSRSTEVVSRIETAIPTLRPIAVAVRAVGFGPNEAVSAMRFDGVALSVPTGLKANAQGVVETSFTIPTGIAAGVKRFEIDGAGGSHGEALFEGRGTLVSQTTRERVTTTIWWYDPLAQTFTLPESKQVAAVDLWFTVRGNRPVTVQIRETVAGFPTRTVLAEGRIDASAIQTTGPTRIAFDLPVWLQAGVEYVLVVLTDDADTSVAIAELGKWDAAGGRWVTSQPYQVGVLLSSSNASTWTAHQDKDLAFRLLSVSTSAATRSVTVAQNVSVANATDLLALGALDLPKSGCSARVRLTLDDGRVLSTVLGGTVSLQAPYSGKVQVAVDLTGLPDATPILAPGVQLVVGTLAQTADYVSRAIPAKPSFTARVIAEVFAPGTASVTAKAESGSAGSYATLPAVNAAPVGDGWVEIEWRASSLQGVGADKTTRVRLEISNSAAHRALVRNLRAVIV